MNWKEEIKPARDAQLSSAAALIWQQGPMLTARALTAGLASVRLRSTGARLEQEAHRFLRLLCGSIGHAPVSWQPHSLVLEEVRHGFLAAASLAEGEQIFAIWRRALACLAGAGVANLKRIQAALLHIENECVRGIADWSDDRLDVIVIGASAGGIQPLLELLPALHPDLPATVLVVVHVSPLRASELPLVLGRSSRLPVLQATQGSPLYRGHVYIAGPGLHMGVERSCLALLDSPPVHGSKPSADILFQSAAQVFEHRVISVVLSGSGADGSQGTRRIHEQGGITLVQDPSTSAFRQMPDAAVATGAVDFVLPLDLLGDRLQDLAYRGRRRAAA